MGIFYTLFDFKIDNCKNGRAERAARRQKGDLTHANHNFKTQW